MAKGKFDDLTGKVIGGMRVLSRCHNFEGKSDTRVQYLVECQCGRTMTVPARNLKRAPRNKCPKCNPKTGTKGFSFRERYWGENAKMLS